jgi:hypothetical protein
MRLISIVPTTPQLILSLINFYSRKMAGYHRCATPDTLYALSAASLEGNPLCATLLARHQNFPPTRRIRIKQFKGAGLFLNPLQVMVKNVQEAH